MKGIVFNLLEGVVTSEHGDDVWDELLERAGVDGAYTTLGNYPDADLAGLVGAASELLGEEPQTLVRWFGRASIPAFADSHGALFDGHRDTRAFLLTVTEMIHPEVRKLYPGADVPDFTYETGGDGALVMLYSSPRKLCAYAEGLIEGAAAHYGERVEIGHPRCMHRGDDHCRLEIALSVA